MTTSIKSERKQKHIYIYKPHIRFCSILKQRQLIIVSFPVQLLNTSYTTFYFFIITKKKTITVTPIISIADKSNKLIANNLIFIVIAMFIEDFQV